MVLIHDQSRPFILRPCTTGDAECFSHRTSTSIVVCSTISMYSIARSNLDTIALGVTTGIGGTNIVILIISVPPFLYFLTIRVYVESNHGHTVVNRRSNLLSYKPRRDRRESNPAFSFDCLPGQSRHPLSCHHPHRSRILIVDSALYKESASIATAHDCKTWQDRSRKLSLMYFASYTGCYANIGELNPIKWPVSKATMP